MKTLSFCQKNGMKKLVKKASLKNGKKLCKKFFMAAHWGHHLVSPYKSY